MSKEISKTLRKMRLAKAFSQAEIAQKLGISRASYIAVEQGKRELSLGEAQKVADLFGIGIEELESGLTPDYEKYKEMILAYLRHAGGRDDKIVKTKLAKLVYLADFGWFYENLKSMSGMPYRKFQYGPVPDAYFRAIDELQMDGRIDVEQKQKEDVTLISENRGSRARALKTLNGDEIALIEKISARWKDKRAKEIVDFTHNQLPYRLCTDEEIIPYELITQEDPDNVY